ncbi:glycoside hydrolase family 9 protein [Crateriforma conspicua]|uniref:Endoglucanase D n=1 Tax=Crateriforma conspicua TaxID=2527996 RepID=A0A5C6FQQ8_9PLAN|nr:glycoside hydrolase family 9 protein [Crateriforma conspicua]TWU64604.1 Endoglucanase D precursor [Crateriforma conspicua]
MRIPILYLCSCTLLFGKAVIAETHRLPVVEHVGAVAPDVLCLRIRAKDIVFGEQSAYQRQPGDEIKISHHRVIIRDGKPFAYLVGPSDDLMQSFDRVVGEPLDPKWASRRGSYRISSDDDPHYRKPVEPVAVYRKSKPFSNTHEEGKAHFAEEHFLYLKMPSEIREGDSYQVQFVGGNLQQPVIDYQHDPRTARSEAVHVSQVGFRPDDPVKLAYLSHWMGDGGGVAYPPNPSFKLVDAETGRVVHSGLGKLTFAKQRPALNGKNNALANVVTLDFSRVSEPGRYRVSVDRIGCSYPFRIDDRVWADAFYKSVRGLFHQRSGIELGPPHTDFRRPRSFHPDDGMTVYQSTFTHGLPGAKGNGIFEKLIAGKTDEVVPNAWGGYMDAGDWDRRPVHLIIGPMLFDLYEMNPDFFRVFDLNLPESGDSLPDVINEALWVIDFHKRIQTEDGGIRAGIESAAHPRRGECSWQESLDVMAFAPNPAISYEYAGAAARAAWWLKQFGDDRYQDYESSAMRAYRWAGDNASRFVSGPSPYAKQRCLTALEFWRLTGDTAWHAEFLKTFPDEAGRLGDYEEAIWLYLNFDFPNKNDRVVERCRRWFLQRADSLADNASETAFNWIQPGDSHANTGTFTTPLHVPTLVRAFQLTGQTKYLKAAILGCQCGAGANPMNLCFTTGVGSHWPPHILHLDSRRSHQPAPPGITIQGPRDIQRYRNYGFHRQAEPHVYPAMTTWPNLEAFWNNGGDPRTTEFTVFRLLLPNAYVWGALAAREDL